MEAFTERQSFLKKWWMIMVPSLLVAFIIPIVTGLKGVTDVPEMLISVAITLPVIILLAFLSLTSRIDEQGVTMKFSFQFKGASIRWNDVKRIELGEYSPLFEYGGWGYKRGWRGKKRAYNVAGDKGLKLILKDDRSVLLGTQKLEKMKEYLQYIRDKYQITALADLPKAQGKT